MAGWAGYLRGKWLGVLAASFALLVLPLALFLLLPVPDLLPYEPTPTEAPPTFVEELPPPQTTPTRTVSGAVSGEDGAPLAGVTVRLENAEGEVRQSVRTDTEGNYKLLRVSLEAGALVAEKAGYGVESKDLSAADQPTDVSVDFSLTAAEWVGGIVVGPDKEPIAGAFVGCEDSDDPLLGAPTDEEGRFQLPPDADGCQGIAQHPKYGPSEPTKLVAGDDNRLVLDEPASISGTVIDDQGLPVKSYRIGVESFRPANVRDLANLRTQGETVNNELGEFELKELIAGTYILTATASGLPPAQSESIQLTAGERVRGVRITLSKGATLIGQVLDRSTRAPIAGASVSLDAASSIMAAAAAARTDDEGRFTLAGVPKELFSVEISHPDYRTRIVSGLQAGGAELRENFDLEVAEEGEGKRELAGIGAVLAQNPGGVVVARVISSGPAAEAGIEKNDMIVNIDGKETSSMTLSDCVQTLRGPEGTRVTMTVSRDGDQITKTITRATIVH